MASIQLTRRLANETGLLLAGTVIGAPDCRTLRAELRPTAPDETVICFVEAPVADDGSFRLVLPLQAVPASYAASLPCAGPFRLTIFCAGDPSGLRWPDKAKPPEVDTLDCQPMLRLDGADVDGSCVAGDGVPLRVVRPRMTVRRESRLGDIAVGVEVLTGAVVRERQVLLCPGEEAVYALTTVFRVPGGTRISWRAGFLEGGADGPMTQVQSADVFDLEPCLPPPPPPPPPGPGVVVPAWCKQLPLSCLELLALWRSLFLVAIAALYVGLALAPPDWGARVLGYLIRGDVAAFAAGAQQMTTSIVGGATGSGAAGAVVGGVAGTVAPVVGNIIGGAGGGVVGAGVGGAASGLGAGTGLALTEAERRTLDAFIALADGLVVLGGMFFEFVGGICLIAGLLTLLLWWLCCGRSHRCAFWTQMSWVLEAAMAVVLPLTGTAATLLTGALAWVGGAAAAGRVSSAFFLNLAGGVVVSLVLYGFVRWRRDVNQCPVRPLWLWPWVE